MGMAAGESWAWINTDGFNGNAWRPERYVLPQNPSVNAAAGETARLDFTVHEFSAFVEGTCTLDGEPVEGLEIEAQLTPTGGVAIRTESMTDEDGHYRMGAEPGVVTNLSLPIFIFDYDVLTPAGGGYANIQVEDGDVLTGYDFTLARANVYAPVGGSLTYTDGAPAAGVYVAAVHSWPVRKNRFLITHTDQDGNFLFPYLGWGEWQIGVYLEGSEVTPPMRYYNLGTGDAVDDADFVLTIPSGVEPSEGTLPTRFTLHQNYPNPFNPVTEIRYNLPAGRSAYEVRIEIYNATGQRVKILSAGSQKPGRYSVTWDGTDNQGQYMSSGLYLYSIKAGRFVQTRKMLLLR
jgi:5-hydroxyisourate hydrolase-like protein (transthyretin family)